MTDDEVGQPLPVLSFSEAVSNGAAQRAPRDPIDIQPRPSKNERRNVTSCLSGKERLLDELGFKNDADDDSGDETSSAGEDIMSSSAEASDEELPERDRHPNRFILCCCSVRHSMMRKTCHSPVTLESKRKLALSEQHTTSTCFQDPDRMVAPSPPPLIPPSPRKTSPPPEIFTHKRIRLPSETE